jgi:hypothetical protein
MFILSKKKKWFIADLLTTTCHQYSLISAAKLLSPFLSIRCLGQRELNKNFLVTTTNRLNFFIKQSPTHITAAHLRVRVDHVYNSLLFVIFHINKQMDSTALNWLSDPSQSPFLIPEPLDEI